MVIAIAVSTLNSHWICFLPQIRRRRRPTNPQAHAHIRPPVRFCAARAHRSFLHLLINSLSTSHPVLHSAPGFLRRYFPSTLQTRVLSRIAPRILQTTLPTMMSIIVVPRTHRFAHQSFIASRIQRPPACIIGLRPMALAVTRTRLIPPFTPARAN